MYYSTVIRIYQNFEFAKYLIIRYYVRKASKIHLRDVNKITFAFLSLT